MSALDELEIAAIRGGIDERVLNRARAERDAEVERAVQADRAEIEKVVVKAIMKINTGTQKARDWTLADLRGFCADAAQAAIRARGEKGAK